MPAPHRSPWRVDPAVAARILALTRFNLGPHQLAWRPGSAPLDGTWALAPPTGVGPRGRDTLGRGGRR